MIRTLVCIAALAFIAAVTNVAPAASQVTIPFPAIEKTVEVEGTSIAIPIKLEAGSGDGRVTLRANVLLADLQAKSAEILNRLADRKSSCQLRWSFPNLAEPAVSDGRLRLSGSVRAEIWVCDLIKTRIARDTADFTLAIYPQFTPDRISFGAELEKFDVGQSILAQLGLEDELRKSIEEELNKALAGDSASLAFPTEIVSLNPKFTNIELRDNAGKAEVHIVAEAPASATVFAKLIELFR